MNIFFLDKSPTMCAHYMVDSHVLKMVLETAQILSTAHRVLDDVKGGIYKATHVNHPSSVWARSSDCHYRWLFVHFDALLREYTARYGKVHASARLYDTLLRFPDNIPSHGFTPPPCCMPDEYKISDDAVTNYREYYKHGKKHLHKWKHGIVPEWIK